jgi:hypothetical protein
MSRPEKRIPGQDNAAYERRDPNADFLGTESLEGGADPSFVRRGLRAFLAWLDRRKQRVRR